MVQGMNVRPLWIWDCREKKERPPYTFLRNEPTGEVFLMPYEPKSDVFSPLLGDSEGFFHCTGQGKGAAILL